MSDSEGVLTRQGGNCRGDKGNGSSATSSLEQTTSSSTLLVKNSSKFKS